MISSLLNEMVGYLCVKLAGVGLNICVERQRAILEDASSHSCLAKRYCRKLTFWACMPPPVFMLARMCVNWFYSRDSKRMR